jgi:hypothetical protein
MVYFPRTMPPRWTVTRPECKVEFTHTLISKIAMQLCETRSHYPLNHKFQKAVRSWIVRPAARLLRTEPLICGIA